MPLQLPGREARLAEPAIDSMPRLAAEVADAIAPVADRPHAFLGHSLGAWVALEVARELRRRGRQPPRAFVVAASPAPQRPRASSNLHHLPDTEFVAEMSRRFDGIPPAVRDNEALLQILLPAMRADMQLLESYQYADEPPLATDLIALGGADDPAASPSALADWRQLISGAFTCRFWPGGHFFLFQTENSGPPALSPAAQWITTRLLRYVET